jgi:hypothetical protein
MAQALRRTKHPRWLISLIEGLQSSLSNQLLTLPGPFTTGSRRTSSARTGAPRLLAWLVLADVPGTVTRPYRDSEGSSSGGVSLSARRVMGTSYDPTTLCTPPDNIVFRKVAKGS